MATPKLTENPPGADPGEAGRRLDRSLAHGLAWTGSAKWATQVLSWASTLVVARLLTPADYGITGMAGVYLGLVQLVSEFGLGAALVQRRDLNDTQVARLGGLSLLFGIGLFALSAALAPMIAGFFGEPQVRQVITVLAVMFVVTALQVVPNSLLTRDLAFRTLALIEGVEALIQIAITLALAIAGARYWALVLGGVTAKTVSTVLLLRARPHALAWPRDFGALRGALTFGGRVVISRLTWYVYSNADFAIIGRLLGSVALGAYTFGWNIASIPVDKVTGVLGRVAMPVFAAVQRDRAAVARYLLLLSEGLAMLVLPASLGLALVAPDFVEVVLGPQWRAAVIPLQALSAHVTFRCLLSSYAQALIALDETQQTVRVGIVQVLVLPAAFLFAAQRWGINGVAIAWLVVHPLVTVPLLLRYALRRVDLPVGRLIRALWPALSSAAVMVAAVLAVQAAMAGSPGPLRLGAAVATGGIAYGGALVLFHRRRVRELVAGAKALRSGAAATAG